MQLGAPVPISAASRIVALSCALARLPLLRTPRLEGDIFFGCRAPDATGAVVFGYQRGGLDAEARKLACPLAFVARALGQFASIKPVLRPRRTFPTGAMQAKNDPKTPLEAYRRNYTGLGAGCLVCYRPLASFLELDWQPGHRSGSRKAGAVQSNDRTLLAAQQSITLARH